MGCPDQMNQFLRQRNFEKKKQMNNILMKRNSGATGILAAMVLSL